MLLREVHPTPAIFPFHPNSLPSSRTSLVTDKSSRLCPSMLPSHYASASEEHQHLIAQWSDSFTIDHRLHPIRLIEWQFVYLCNAKNPHVFVLPSNSVKSIIGAIRVDTNDKNPNLRINAENKSRSRAHRHIATAPTQSEKRTRREKYTTLHNYIGTIQTNPCISLSTPRIQRSSTSRAL